MEVKDNTLINREISWLYFNERVLQETMDKTNPLLERIKFLGIFSNNRDEFFRVRVATLKRMIKVQKQADVPDMKYKLVLNQILKIVTRQEKIFTRAYEDLVKELAKNKIFFIDEKKLTAEQGEFVYKFYTEKVRPNLFPLMLENVKSLESIQDASIFLAVHLKNTKDKSPGDYALIQMPTETIGRFLILPSKGKKHYVILLDDVIRYCLGDIFSVFGFNAFEAYTMKFTRDSELDIDNDVSRSFLDLMMESVKKRRRGETVRFVYDASMPDELLQKLLKKFNISKHDTVRGGGRYHNFKDFMDFPRFDLPELYYPSAPPLPHPDLKPNISFFETIRAKDVMLHFPYQSFKYTIDMLREASIDPGVRSVKMTFYRTAKDSAAMNALINAARNGKYVTVFMEIQARFDEEANIFWTKRLQDEGVKIIQTIPGFKVHCKLILIRRRENEINRFYANVSTGNYNEATANVFSDFSLLTSNSQICEDVYNIFEMLESKFMIPAFKVLEVSPFRLRDFFTEMLEREMINARSGKPAWVVLKMNSLVDKRLAIKLYEASKAGVHVDLLVRGMCVIKPGVPGLSENIKAFSIVDKFLEHSRIYICCNNGQPDYFISSSDWMPRNLDHRIEVVCPVYDREIQRDLWEIVQIQMRDNTKARLLSPDNLNQYKKDHGAESHRAQFEIYEYYKRKLAGN
jgi:polyphosphate kinase